MVTISISEPIYQSQPCLTIQYTYNERLEGSSWCEMAESVRTHTILVWNVGTRGSWVFHNRWLKSRGLVVVVYSEFQSQSCLTIQHTNSERLGGFRCCELPESVWRHSIWVWKVGTGQYKFVPSHISKIGCGDHFNFRAHIPISTMPDHSIYL